MKCLCCGNNDMRFAGVEKPITDGGEEEKYPVSLEEYKIPVGIDEKSIDVILDEIKHMMNEQNKYNHVRTLQSKDDCVRYAVRDLGELFEYRIYICLECGFVQRKVSEEFLKEARRRTSTLDPDFKCEEEL